MKYEMSGQVLPVLMLTLKNKDALITTGRESAWHTLSIKKENVSEGLVKMKYTLDGKQGMASFASSMPGHIKGAEIRKDRTLIVRADAFIAAEESVQIEPYLNEIINGKELVMYKLSGEGMAFYEMKGTSVEYNLVAGQALDMTLDMIVSMEEGCTIEALDDPDTDHVLLKGPGKVFIQTMSMSQFMDMVKDYL